MAESKKKADTVVGKTASKKSEVRYRSMAEIRKTFYPKTKSTQGRRTKNSDARIVSL